MLPHQSSAWTIVKVRTHVQILIMLLMKNRVILTNIPWKKLLVLVSINLQAKHTSHNCTNVCKVSLSNFTSLDKRTDMNVFRICGINILGYIHSSISPEFTHTHTHTCIGCKLRTMTQTNKPWTS